MGNDEHSQNVFKRARELGEDPQAYCDQMEGVFREVWARLGCRSTISSARPSRATTPACRSLVEACHARGDIYEGQYEGWYCVSCEAFKQEKDLVDGKCRSTSRSRSGFGRRTTSSGCRAISRRCSSTTPRIPEFISPSAPQRDPAAASKPASRTSRSAGPGRPGASRCRSTRRASSTSGSTRSSTTPRRSATAPTTTCSRRGGRPTSTSSARTSRGSTASSGRRC